MWSRRSPFLLLAAALAALAVFLAHDAPAAQAGPVAELGDEERITMLFTLRANPQRDSNNQVISRGCVSTTECSGFIHAGTRYGVESLVLHTASSPTTPNQLILKFGAIQDVNADRRATLTLHVGDRKFPFANANPVDNNSNNKINELRWSNPGLSWSNWEQVHVAFSITAEWAATLTVRNLGGNSGRGCDTTQGSGNNQCSAGATLTNDRIFVSYTEGHTIDYILLGTNPSNQQVLYLGLTNPSATYGARTALERYTLYVNNVPFALADAIRTSSAEANAYWLNPGINWTVGQTVNLRLTLPTFTGVTFRDAANTREIRELRVAEGGTGQFNVRLPRDPGAGQTVNVKLSKSPANCDGCLGAHDTHGDAEAIGLTASTDRDSTAGTVTLRFTGGSGGNWNTNQRVVVSGVADSDGGHEHTLIVGSVSTTSGNHVWYDHPSGARGLYVTVTDGADDGRGAHGTEGVLGAAPRPVESQQQSGGDQTAQQPPAPPRNVTVVPGDGRLTVSWEVGPRDGVADSDIRHALRWSQTPGKWANPHPGHVGPNDGYSVSGGVASYVITGLRNGVPTGVFVRSYTGGNYYERSPASSEWVRIKGPQTTPNSPPTVASPIADVGPLTAGGDATVDLSGVFADADGDWLTLEVESSDDHVSVGLIQYTNGAELWVLATGRGTAELTVTAYDHNGGIVADTFTVTVKEAPTVAKPIADIASLKAGASKQVPLSGVFADADGDALTLSAASSDNAVATVSSQLDPSTGSATAITVTAVASGTAAITVTAQDTDGNRVSDTFDVTVPAAQQKKQKAQPQSRRQPTQPGGSGDDPSDTQQDGNSDQSQDNNSDQSQDNNSNTQQDGNSDQSQDGNSDTQQPVLQEYTAPPDEHAAQEQTVAMPGAVSGLTLTAVGSGVRVGWTPPTAGSAPARYIVHLKSDGGPTGSGKTKRPKAARTQVTFNNLEPGTTYNVWVRAANASGKGERAHATITLPPT
jgi:hypothetical protein